MHAILLLRKKNFDLHKKAIVIALALGSVTAILQPLSGDFSAKDVAERQPLKLAAMEGQFKTERNAALTIGGIPDVEKQEMNYGIQIPGFLSYLAYGDFDAEVKGLNDFPRENWPPVVVTHLSFQTMVGAGTFLAFVGVLFIFLWFRKREKIFSKPFLKLIALCTPLGFIAVEAGWFVTEVGRQPWIIYEIMRTSESVTPMPGQIVHLLSFVLIYLVLTVVAVWLMKRQIKVLHEGN
jgi:cytochrome bd ubiquinol oxidase subunit I